MNEFQFSIQNIIDGQGMGIAITGMSIVFFTLIVISLAIAALPKILDALKGILPPENTHHAAVSKPTRTAADEEEAVAVAVGFALHMRRQAGD